MFSVLDRAFYNYFQPFSIAYRVALALRPALNSFVHFIFSFVLRGVVRVDTVGHGQVYFVAPQKYLGDKRFAYTYSLSFKLQQDNSSTPVLSTKGDVILKGEWFRQALVAKLQPPGTSLKNYKV